ncbi:MAG: hypothetical protein K1X64_08095 [Myxococcaceae bacterium]|nr:hypothetical protein [Myxococcaceae bacterium]
MQAISLSLNDAVLAALNRNTSALERAFRSLADQLREVTADIKNGTLKPDLVPKVREQFRNTSIQLGMQQVSLPAALLDALAALEQPGSVSGSNTHGSADKSWKMQSPQELAKTRRALGAKAALERLDRADPGDPLVHHARSSGMTTEQMALVQGNSVSAREYVAKGDLDTLKQLVEQRAANPDFVKQLGDELRALAQKTSTQEEALAATKVLRDLNITQLVTIDINESSLTVSFGAAVQKMLSLVP